MPRAQKHEPGRAHTSQAGTSNAARQPIVFDEDDNEVQMEVHTQDTEFLSDGELDSHRDEESQNPLQSDGSQSEDEKTSQSSSDSQSDEDDGTRTASDQSARSTPAKTPTKK